MAPIRGTGVALFMAGSDHSVQGGSHACQRVDEPERGDDQGRRFLPRHHLFAPRVLKDVGMIAVDIILKAVPVSDVMSSPVMSVPAKADVVEAARIMLEDKVGSLPVVEGGKVVGIVTETVVLRQICKADAACAKDIAEIVVSYP